MRVLSTVPACRSWYLVSAAPWSGANSPAMMAARNRGRLLLDNLGSHKGVAVRSALRAAGAWLLILPVCSPDLNPIE